MTEAWMVRSSERQELLETLKQKAMDLEEPPRRLARYDLARTCLAFLEDETAKPTESQAATFFFTEALPAITSFARAKEERDIIVCELLTWVVGSVTARFRGDLTHKEIVAPKTIFHATSAMEEVEGE